MNYEQNLIEQFKQSDCCDISILEKISSSFLYQCLDEYYKGTQDGVDFSKLIYNEISRRERINCEHEQI